MIEHAKVVNVFIERGVNVNVLNIGIIDSTPASKLIRNIFLSFT